MKIGLIRRGFSATGGAESYLLRLARGLEQTGHTPVLITSHVWPADRWPHGEIIRLQGRTPTAFAAAFAKERASMDCDVTFSLERVPGCDVFRAGDGVHAAWQARREKFEPFWKSWFRVVNRKHSALQKLEAGVFETARFVIANSRMVAEEIPRWYSYPPERICVVPNGIGPALPGPSRDAARAKLQVPPNAFCVLFVGTGWERKGLRTAIEAVEYLGEGAILLVAGRGPAKQYASPAVRFLGPLSDLSEVFAAADVFTLPTIYDPFSNACLEALAAGLPVVTTTGNGFSEIIRPGIHGDVVKPGNPHALANALMLWRGRAWKETAAACQELASRYSIERNVAATLEVLTAVPR